MTAKSYPALSRTCMLLPAYWSIIWLKMMSVCIVSGSTDNLTFILSVAGGAVGAAIVLAAVVGVVGFIIWRVTSTSAVAATTALRPGFASTPVVVASKPSIRPRFIPSQQMHSRGYNAWYNNGYHDNECPLHGRSWFQSRINVESGQSQRF